MRPEDASRKTAVKAALATFESARVGHATTSLLNAMGYHSSRTASFSPAPKAFLHELERESGHPIASRRDWLRVDEWRECSFIFQLTNDEIPFLASDTLPLGGRAQMQRNQIESLSFIAIDLGSGAWSRSELARVTREVNRCFPSPVVMVFKHRASKAAPDGTRRLVISIAVIDRRPNVRHENRDVVGGRISVIKDVDLLSPHHAHVKILAELAFDAFASSPSNFRALYDAWLGVLSTEALNKRFYKDLAEWFMWAARVVEFPKGGGKDRTQRNQLGVIRMLTRLIFIWFIKERGLVPEALFNAQALAALLKKSPATHSEGDDYYLGVLQNLFFATLNVEMGTERKWADNGSGMKGDRMVHSLYRHRELFNKPDEALELFMQVPFLNGGLFECLDRELSERDMKRTPALKSLASKEGTGFVLRVDGFSRRKEAQPHVPNELFFGVETKVDLNEEFGTKGRDYSVRGLLHIFNSYKFTVHENTPVEEEVALDPELLGKVFENLLASYNEDTQTTARKLSGSFYTPRVVVDYMVDEALIAHFHRHLPEDTQSAERDEKLRRLLAYDDDKNPLNDAETSKVIAAIEKLKLLDPACGSGAFPMGALGKLVHVLSKLDPGNILWRQQNRVPLETQLATAENIPDPNLQDERRSEARSALEKFDEDFSSGHHADYTRKLYLIEKCIHGVDIQPIAVQIAKLRFFIALVVSQEIDRKKPNLGVTALPNLETKIVAADSLLPAGNAQQVLRSHHVIQCEKELSIANKAYFGARTLKNKRKWRERIVELRDELATLLEKEHMFSAKEARTLVSWNPFDQNSFAGFFDREWMFQMTEGFDVCIGNPPYVRQERIKELKDDFKRLFDSFTGTADLYVYFYERSVRLLKPGGILAFITSNKWYRAKYGEKLREWMSRQTRLLRVIDFGDESVFDAIAYPTVMIAQKRVSFAATAIPGRDEQVLAMNWTGGENSVEDLPEVFARDHFKVPQAALKRDGWQFEIQTTRRLVDRIKAIGQPLVEYVGKRIYNGIKTGLNPAFVISGSKREELIRQDAGSADIIRPFVRGRDVKRWSVTPQDMWLIFVPWHFPLHTDSLIQGASTKAEREFENRYPAVYRHLHGYKSELAARDQSETGIRYEWYALQRARSEYLYEFEQPKIFIPAIENAVNYAFDSQGLLGNDKTSIVVAPDNLYVLAILNSSVSWWFTQRTFSSKQGGFYEFKPMYVADVPIPPKTQKQADIVEALVGAILIVTDPRLENLLNGLVYELFFPDDLHLAGLHLFDAAEKAGIGRLAALKPAAREKATRELIRSLSDTEHPLYRQLFDLRALEVVRIIEGQE